MSSSPEGPRNFITTKDDHAGVALTVCSLLATWTVLCYVVRVQQRVTLSGPFGLDDIVCDVGTVFAVIQTIVSGLAINYGFGKSLKLLTQSRIVDAEKAIYAAQLLYLVTNALTKCSMALILARLMHIKFRVRVCYAILAASALWGLGSVFAEAIICTSAKPWSIVGNICSNKVLSWEVITAINVAIEVALACMPLWLVWKLQTDKWRKAVVVMIFSLRVPVIAAAIIRVSYLTTSIPSSQPLLTGVIPFICLEVEMHYGLMAATFPCLKPFIANFNTAWGTYDASGTHGYGSSQRYAHTGRPGNATDTNASKLARDHNSQEEEGLQSGNYKNITQVWSNQDQAPRHNRHSLGSVDSQSGIIRQTFTCEVRYEDCDQEASYSKRSCDRDKVVL